MYLVNFAHNLGMTYFSPRAFGAFSALVSRELGTPLLNLSNSSTKRVCLQRVPNRDHVRLSREFPALITNDFGHFRNLGKSKSLRNMRFVSTIFSKPTVKNAFFAIARKPLQKFDKRCPTAAQDFGACY